MGGGIQPQGHVQVLVNLIDLGLGLQQAIDAPRSSYMSGRDVLLEDEITATVIDRLIALGHVRAAPPGVLRSSMRRLAHRVAKPLGKWPHSQLHLHNCDLMQRLSGKRPFLAVEGAELTVSDVEQ
jgi:hypothetical protein